MFKMSGIHKEQKQCEDWLYELKWEQYIFFDTKTCNMTTFIMSRECVLVALEATYVQWITRCIT